MITLVRFPNSVEVLKDSDARSTWQVGSFGVTRISRGTWGELVFETNKAGVKITVCPLPGTVIHEYLAHDDWAAGISAQAQQGNTSNGPEISTPSPESPRARPIKPRR